MNSGNLSRSDFCDRILEIHRLTDLSCDYFNKFRLFFPLRLATATKVSKIMEEQIFLIFGVPELSKANNRVGYKSKEFLKLMKDYKVKFYFTPLFCLDKNPTQRYNRTFKKQC